MGNVSDSVLKLLGETCTTSAVGTGATPPLGAPINSVGKSDRLRRLRRRRGAIPEPAPRAVP